ncbi:MAG: aspartate kinase [Candidatus Altiarchaeota archaeon]
MIVMKFGGSSMGDGSRISGVADLVVKDPREKVVVVSAVGGVTDKLLNLAEDIVNHPSAEVEKKVNQFTKDLYKLHEKVVLDAIKDKKIVKELLGKISIRIDKLRITLLGVGYLEDLSPKSLDYVLSFGERLSASILEGCLKERNVKTCMLTGARAGIVTDSAYGSARPISDLTKKGIKSKLKPLISRGCTPVVTGFIAANKEGFITTLGRGGSDYTASILGRFLNAEEVQIWTDVDGILSTDPRIVSHAELIPTLSYTEAMDLAYFGAKVIHSKMIAPAMMADIPVRVKNTFNPDSEGTMIVKTQKKIKRVVKAVAIDKKAAIINLHGIGLADTPNIAGRLFNTLGKNNINVVMISGSSESNLSIVVNRKDVATAKKLLTKEFGNNGITDISVMEKICLITIVGAGMHGTKGIASKIFKTVADSDVNLIMIAQGSSEVNIAFVVKESDGDKTVKILHKKFIEQKVI